MHTLKNWTHQMTQEEMDDINSPVSNLKVESLL